MSDDAPMPTPPKTIFIDAVDCRMKVGRKKVKRAALAAGLTEEQAELLKEIASAFGHARRTADKAGSVGLKLTLVCSLVGETVD